MFSKLFDSWQRYFHELLHKHTDDHAIAIGFAVGTFIALVPNPPFAGLLLGALALFLYPRMNKIALFGAIALFNPFVLIPFYSLTIGVAHWFFGPSFALPSFTEFHFHQWLRPASQYLVTNLILSTLFAAFGYFLMRGIVSVYRSRKKRKEGNQTFSRPR
jgi:uncharacterized protein (DUF2062 family)